MTNEEIKKMCWQINDDNDILNAVLPWDFHRFVCVMKDNTIQIFTGMCDETYNGEVSQNLDCIDDNMDYNLDDIVMWIEVPDVK